MICGVEGGYMSHLRHVREIIGFRPGHDFAALSPMITSKGALPSPIPRCGQIRVLKNLPKWRRWRPSMSSASTSSPKSPASHSDCAAMTCTENAPRYGAAAREASSKSRRTAKCRVIQPFGRPQLVLPIRTSVANIPIMPNLDNAGRGLSDDHVFGRRGEQGPIPMGPSYDSST